MRKFQILAVVTALLFALSDASLAAQKRQKKPQARGAGAYGYVNPQSGGAAFGSAPAAASQFSNRPYPYGPYPDRPYGDPGRW
jgi:hypothetical protein